MYTAVIGSIVFAIAAIKANPRGASVNKLAKNGPILIPGRYLNPPISNTAIENPAGSQNKVILD